MKKVKAVSKYIDKNCKRYKKNTLSKRIRRTLSISNAISTILLIMLMIGVIGGLVSFLGSGFSKYTANEMAKDVAGVYTTSMDHREFMGAINKMAEDQSLMDGDEDMLFIREVMVEDADIEDLHNIEVAYETLEDFNYFDYQIYMFDKLIYDSTAVGTGMTKFDEMNKESANTLGLFTSATTDIVDENGEVIGMVEVGLSHDVIFMSYLIAFGLALAVLLTNFIISRIVSFVASKIVSRPLEVLADQMHAMAGEDLEDAFDMTLEVKNPVSEVSSLKDSTEKIMAKISEYYQTMLAQNQELEAQRDVLADHRDELEAQRDELEAQRDELEAQNEELVVTGDNLQSMNNAYLSRTLKLQNLMDNIGQGFMTFNENLMVNPEYSVVCSSMLHGIEAGESIEGRKVTDLLIEDTEQQSFIEELLVKIIKGSDHERELFMPLLPEEIHNNGQIQQIDYKIVRDEQFKEQMMVILTDMTHTRALEDQMNQERDILQMIVKVLMNREDFVDQLDGFKMFITDTYKTDGLKDYDEILRTFHTYKGTFSQYYMHYIADRLNDLETIAYDKDVTSGLANVTMSDLNQALDRDLELIEAYVGSDFIRHKDLYTVKEEKIIEIEQKIRKILPASEYNKIMPIIKSIRYRSVKDNLKNYPEYTVKLGDRLGKSIGPFEVTGDDVFVDYDVYQSVLKSMVHIFRNAVDHGVEAMDDRIEVGKNETASVTAHILKESDSFTMTVSDDGQGIDTEKVVAKAIQAGAITEAQAGHLTEKEKLNLIFGHGVSTKDLATAISGRGVGLAAVKEYVDYLGGEIRIESEVGKGTSISVKLPILQSTDIMDFEADHFLDRVQKVASNYFDSLEMALGSPSRDADDRITLYRVSALLNIKGSIDGLIVISCNEKTAKDMVKSFIYEAITPEEEVAYAEDVLGEVTNTIMGNVLGSFEEDGAYLSLGVPVMLSNTSAYIKYSNRQILSAKYEKDGYILTISLLMTDSTVETSPDFELLGEQIEGGLNG